MNGGDRRGEGGSLIIGARTCMGARIQLKDRLFKRMRQVLKQVRVRDRSLG